MTEQTKAEKLDSLRSHLADILNDETISAEEFDEVLEEFVGLKEQVSDD
jgi:hypothetical protein